MKRTIKIPVIFLCCISALSCNPSADLENGAGTININDLETWVSKLGSDEFMGRAPFTMGEEITVEYLADQLKKTGFDPLFGDSYYQEVPMVRISSVVEGPVRISNGSDEYIFYTPDDLALISPHVRKSIEVTGSEMIFAGFGIVAPEYEWNDYDGLDVKGKTVVVLINDPGLYTGDTTLFKGREMTYYGRWTYKYEEAARQGAAGVIIIHETKGAGYDYSIPRKSSITPNLYIESADSNLLRCEFTGWISSESAEQLLKSKGIDVSELRSEACRKEFKGFPLDLNITFSVKNTFEYNKSKNVAGIITGRARPSENIVFTAHWDHFGIGEPENGDSIYNGAVDNGTSMAWALSIGKAFSSLRIKPERSVIILFPTAEEDGLIGSTYYTEHPVFPIENTVACINNDLLLPIGKMKDVMITGFGQSELDDYVKETASEQDRYTIEDPDSHTGMYFRSDHFSFARKGVPSLYARGNTHSREYGKEWARNQVQDYIKNRYHKPADNYDPDKWDLSGIAEDAELAFRIGYRLVNSDEWPGWKENSEFKELRK